MNTGKAHRRKAQTRIGAVVKDHDTVEHCTGKAQRGEAQGRMPLPLIW